jgi:hypothetical protein
MKAIHYTLLAALALAANASADIITQWNFNSDPPDNPQNTSTGRDVPIVGTGTISVIGTATQIYTAGATTSGGASTDPATSDNSAYHTRGYPLPGEGNKTSGVQVNVSTVGYESIVVTWDQQNSGTASRYLRFQYSLDGSSFVDYAVLNMSVAAAFVNGRTVDLNPIQGANNNPNFAFRLVAEFENTAVASGAANYAATGGGTYGTNGTMRFDMLTISGSLPDGNTFPTITPIADQTILENSSTDVLPFQVGDAETPADQLIVTGTSSNPALIPDAGIVIDGGGANRTVSVGPNYDSTGIATITLYVIDGGGKSNSTSFRVTVVPGNTPPTVSLFTNYHTVASTAFAPIDFTISDAQSAASSLTVLAASSNQELVPDANLSVTGNGDTHSLNIAPAPGKSGTAAITVTVSDPEGLTANRTFNAMVVPSSNVVLTEPYAYADGALTTNSGGLWVTRAGDPNETQVAGGVVHVTSAAEPSGEDVVARLIGGPYAVGSGTVLYASFDVTFSALPGVAPDIFAHFSGTNANDLLGRVLASTTNAPAGFFRLGVANTISSAADVTNYPLDLSLYTPYQVVIAYDVTVGSSKLWVNPASGGGPVDAIDPREPMPINSYGLRQSSRIGTMTMDNLLVGFSFENVTPNLTRVRIRRVVDSMEVYWPSDSGYFLESTLNLANPDWQPVTEPARSENGWDIVTISNPTDNQFFRLKKNQ